MTPIALTRFVYHLMEAKNLKELSPVQTLGCPYNPPNPNASQPIGSGNTEPDLVTIGCTAWIWI